MDQIRTYLDTINNYYVVEIPDVSYQRYMTFSWEPSQKHADPLDSGCNSSCESTPEQFRGIHDVPKEFVKIIKELINALNEDEYDDLLKEYLNEKSKSI